MSTPRVTVTEAVELTDLDLVRLAQDGDTGAFGDLVDRNRRAVFRAALAAVGSAAEAEDVTQETFVTAYRKLSSFRGDAAFRTWLLAIAWRKAIDRRKALNRWWRSTSSIGFANEDDASVIERLPDERRSQHADLEAAALQAAVRKAIAALPRKLRDALLLAGSGEHTYQQIGEMLGSPVGTVKWRVSEARRVLRGKLEAQGFRIQD